MRAVYSLIEKFKTLDIHLYEANGKIRVSDPKRHLTNEFRQQIKALKPDILEFLGNSFKIVPETDLIQRQNSATPPPLSFAQQRLWFLDQLEPDSALYNISMMIRLQGQLDVVALEQSFTYLIARHESLRTTFDTTDGQPMQVIDEPSPFTLSVIAASDEQQVQPLGQVEASTPFNLREGPLLRVQLLKLADQCHFLLLTMHHIISDGWSMGVLISELTHAYMAYTQGDVPTLRELPIQYADFAVWQRDYLSGDTLDRQLSFWREQLTGAPAQLTLPTDRPRPLVQSYRGAHYAFQLDAELTAKLNQLAQTHDATLFMVLHSAFSLLLSRYSRQTDIVIGTPIANRNRAEIEGLIGFFVNTLALRTQLDDNPSFTVLLNRVRKSTLAAYEHQDLPFEQLVDELQLERHLSVSPLFQVMFALQNAEIKSFVLPGIHATPHLPEFPFAKFDLTLNLMESDEGLMGVLEYSTDLFDEVTMASMASHFELLLNGIVEEPDQPVLQLPMLTTAEYQQIVHQWNDTAVRIQPQTIHALFEAQVRQTPLAVALVFGDEQLTYAELNARANQLAHYLIAQGVGTDVLVGICIERGIRMVVGLLAILKVGGAYLPLDPSVPGERLAFMLEDAQVSIVLTEEKLIESLSEQAVELFSLDSYLPTIAAQSTKNPSNQAGPDSLAYVIYTSGSTGRPKGVMVPHRGINRLVNKTNYIEIRASDRMAQASNASFDAATFEIWGALLHGACLVGIPHEVAISPPSLATYLVRQDISILFLTTALFNQVVSHAPEAFANLRYLLFGGEAVDPVSVRTLLDYGAPEHFLHVYGPTENTTYSSWYPIKSVAENARTVPIGKPIANSQIYILDGQLEPVPVAVPGELYLAGSGLALGYLNRPKLTDERFIPNPFGPGKLYKTGDLCRYLPDSNIEFLGRADYQVKIRGFRIELGEIEAHLHQCVGVREAVVVARDEPSGKRIVAYVVGDAPADGLRAALSQQLPNYMIPSAFVPLEAMPLTPNGKIDRRALPAPGIGTGSDSAQLLLPRTPTEQSLVAIWQEVLGIEPAGPEQYKISIHDNFFEIGGHSLLATQVVSRIRQTFALDLPLRTLFENATVVALASEIDHLHSDSQQVVMRRIPLAERTAPLPLSYAQQRLWFLDQLGSSIAYNMPLALELRGPLNITVLQQTLQEIVRRHESLRTTFVVDDGTPYQVVHPEMTIELPVIDLSAYPADKISAEVKGLTDHEATHPFDLSCDAMLRATLLKLSDTDRQDTTTNHYILLLTMHHIASDGWSMGVLVREISTLYEAFSQGQPSPLPDLPIQYADFALWQRTYLQGEVLEEQLRYWTEQLADAAELLQLPTDRARPAQQSGEGGVVSLQLDAHLTTALRRVSQQQGTTLYMTLLASFQVLMARYSGQSDIVVGSPIANRNRQEIEPLIGFFVNTLALRADFSGGNSSAPDKQALSFLDLLAQVQKTTQAAYDHQDIPFERLVEELRPERNLNHNPLVQVIFALQNAPMGAFELSGLNVSPAKSEIQTTRFDLEMHLWEVDDDLQGHCIYSTDLFDQATIERMAGHFQTLLAGIVKNPAQSVAELPLLTEAERHQLLLEWNDTATDYPFEACIHQLFEQQVARTPDAIALVFENQQLSYRELNERANQLAHYLQAQGVGADVLVGICVERSLEMVVGILAILKAGGAYVPLNPSDPQERLALMLSDTKIWLLLTQQKWLANLPEGATTLCLDRFDWQGTPYNPMATRTQNSRATNVAYIMYTSGSTGRPKGVSVMHQNVVRLVKETNFMQFSTDDVFLQLAPITFDAATLEIWGPMLNGGKLVIMPPANPSLHDVARAIGEHKVSTLWLTAALFHLMVDEQLEALGSLRWLLAGGDVLSVPHVQRAVEALPNCQLINGYGPTENTTFTCCYPIDRVTPSQRSIPIGHPIANTQVYILDNQLQPMPIGLFGELYAGGDGLARGYHNNQELTQERFIPNPFAAPRNEGHQSRLYRTGDVARWLASGEIEFLGRMDRQVKLRGFRIELGEIESALTLHPNIQEAVVVAREDGHNLNANNKKLVSYLVAGQIDSETQTEHVEQWQNLYEQTYSQASQQEALAFNLLGWNSSYTGQPIPEIEMAEWVEGTIADIRRLECKRILEIGCGTGLLLSQLAPDCEVYWGTDYSEQAIQHVERLKTATADLGHVVLSQRLADDFTGIAQQQFDCVILNSIVQYFPSVEYLLSVLEGAVRAVSPGGKIYVGDVRNLRLLSAYHAAVQSYQAAEDLPLADLRQRIQQRLRDEEELLVDPDFFYALQTHLPQITQLEIAVKRGHYVNELTQFRYQVVLHVEKGERQIDTGQIDWLEEDWLKEQYTVSTLEKRLHQLMQSSSEHGLLIRNIPNARLQDAMQTLEILEQGGTPPSAKQSKIESVAQLRTYLARQNEHLSPESLWALSTTLPVRVLVTWSRSPGLMDAFFVPSTPLFMPILLPQAERVKKPWRDYTNNPLLGALNRTLVPKVRTWLAEKLPDYMIPSAFVMLDALPLTPNGKVDRKALPAPTSLVRLDDDAFVPPSTATESSLADIWSEVLGRRRLSVWDDFFEIGGHSLMATQMVSRIKSHFQINMPVRDVFENPTIAELGEHIEALLEAKQMTQQSEQADDQLSIDEEMELEEW